MSQATNMRFASNGEMRGSYIAPPPPSPRSLGSGQPPTLPRVLHPSRGESTSPPSGPMRHDRGVEPMFFATPAEFHAWLEAHHADERELLVGFDKKATGRPCMTWSQSVD